MGSAVIPILDEETGALRYIRVETNPEGDALRLKAWREADHERQHAQDEATARAVVKGAAAARTHAEAAEIIRSASDAYGGSDAPAHRSIAAQIGGESRGIMEQARTAEREAIRARWAAAARRDRERDR